MYTNIYITMYTNLYITMYTNLHITTYANLHTNAAKCDSVQAAVKTRALTDQSIIIQVRLKGQDSSAVNIFRVGSGIVMTRSVSCLTVQQKSKSECITFGLNLQNWNRSGVNCRKHTRTKQSYRNYCFISIECSNCIHRWFPVDVM